jgi:hypothetical protein
MEQIIYLFIGYGLAMIVPIVVLPLCIVVAARLVLAQYFHLKLKYFKETQQVR